MTLVAGLNTNQVAALRATSRSGRVDAARLAAAGLTSTQVDRARAALGAGSRGGRRITDAEISAILLNRPLQSRFSQIRAFARDGVITAAEQLALRQNDLSAFPVRRVKSALRPSSNGGSTLTTQELRAIVNNRTLGGRRAAPGLTHTLLRQQGQVAGFGGGDLNVTVRRTERGATLTVNGQTTHLRRGETAGGGSNDENYTVRVRRDGTVHIAHQVRV